MVSPDGRSGSISAHRDALLYGTLLEQGETVEYEAEPQRRVYIHVARGDVAVNGQTLRADDGIRIEDERVVAVQGVASAELLLFDLP